MSKLSGIANKLRALRAIAQDGSGATEHERLTAAAMYADLLEKTHMDASELELREEGTMHVKVEFGLTGNAFLIAQSLNKAIGLFTRCKPWMHSGRGEVHYLGLQSDTEFAEWLVRSLVSHAQGEALSYTMDLDPGMKLYKQDVELFVASCGIRVAERLTSLALQGAMSDTSHALVPVRAKMINEAFVAMGINLRPAQKVSIYGADHAKNAGRAAGDRANFARPVGQAQTLRIGRD